MADMYQKFKAGLDAPAVRHHSITPSDSLDLSPVPREILVIGTGDIAIRDQANNDITYAAVPAYTRLPIRARRVLSTGTTATGIIGWE